MHNINKKICSTEINSCNNNYFKYNISCLKKNRTFKEINKRKNEKIENKFLLSVKNRDNQDNINQKNLYKESIKKFINNPKKDIVLFKDHLMIRKKKLQKNKLNNNIYNNYNFHKFEKRSSCKNKSNNMHNNSEYRSIQHENNNKQLDNSTVNSNTVFITSKTNINNRNNKNIYPREHSYNNTNIRTRSKINNNFSNNSYNISGINKPQSQILPSSTILKNSTINTRFKIKNVNINYFNIMHPNELIFNQQRSNRSKSRPNKSNISNNNNYQINYSNKKNKKRNKNNNIKTDKHSSTNKSGNSLFLMTDLIDVKKLKENIRQFKKGIITKLPDLSRHNDSCLSNNIKKPKINSNSSEQNKIRITKQTNKLLDRYKLNSFDRNKSGIPKKKLLLGNFCNSNSKLISYIKIPNKASNNINRQNNINITSRVKVINRRTEIKNLTDIKGNKSHTSSNKKK